MTYADSRLSAIYPQRNVLIIVKDNTAIGEDSDRLNEEYKRTIEHYLIPTTTRWANPSIRFNTLKAEWEAATAHLSSITEIAIHPAYQQIIGMGTIAIPFILSELTKNPGHWFWALKSITGEDPVPPEHRGRLKQMTEDWLKWGKEQGYIV